MKIIDMQSNRVITTLLTICTMGMVSSCNPTSTPESGEVNQICIDETIQSTLDSLLIGRLVELNTEAAYGAVMEVSTGNLAALSSWGKTKDSIYQSYNNMFLDLRDPGSAFQAVSYAALIETGNITSESLVDTGNTMDNPSTLNYHGKEILDDHPVGMLTAEEALVQSSNIAMVKMVAEAFEEEPQYFLDAISKLGWYETPLMVFEGDTLRAPRVREYKDIVWSKVSLGQISYGYEMQTTPMHLLMFVNSIANNGVRPGVGRICSENTADMVKSALEGVVDRGTACTHWSSNGDIIREGARSQQVRIAGKTGTAQIYANGSYVGNGHYVTFVGFFPAEQPKYSCLVTIKAVPGGNFGRPGGGYMAGPIVRKLAERLYTR